MLILNDPLKGKMLPSMELRHKKEFVGDNKPGCLDTSNDCDGLMHPYEGLGDAPI